MAFASPSSSSGDDNYHCASYYMHKTHEFMKRLMKQEALSMLTELEVTASKNLPAAKKHTRVGL